MTREEKVIELVDNEVAKAEEKYPALNSFHEGYGVLKEEVEESDEEMQNVKDHLETFWFYVRRDDKESSLYFADQIYLTALSGINEMIQAAAMAKRIMRDLK